MIRVLGIAAAVIAIDLIFTGCVTEPKSAKVEEKWISNMHRLSAAHLSLLPIAADGRKFADPNEHEQIKRQLKQMVDASTAIVNDNKAPNADPIIAFTAAQLANETRQAYAAFEMNDLQWSRFALNRVSSQCINCHTRADRGNKDFEISWSSQISALNSVQTVEYLLANRRYQSAYTKALQLASDTDFVSKDPRSWVLAIEKTLGMVVRVNKDPSQAQRLTEAMMNNKSAPFYVRRNAGAWLRDIQAWKKEAPSVRGRDKFKYAVQLVDRGQKFGPRNPASMIRFLRASGMLHELLENTKSPQYGETLLYAGIVADSLRELNLGFLDQYYYETCINHEPHSELAERCYSHLETSVHDMNPFTELDPENESLLVARLADFRKLAEVKDPLSDPRWMRRSWEVEFGE